MMRNCHKEQTTPTMSANQIPAISILLKEPGCSIEGLWFSFQSNRSALFSVQSPKKCSNNLRESAKYTRHAGITRFLRDLRYDACTSPLSLIFAKKLETTRSVGRFQSSFPKCFSTLLLDRWGQGMTFTCFVPLAYNLCFSQTQTAPISLRGSWSKPPKSSVGPSSDSSFRIYAYFSPSTR